MIRRFALIALLLIPGLAAAQPQRSLIAVMESEVRFIDPHFVTANITRIYANMVYDTLFGATYGGEVRPQMVESWTVSPDGLLWTFTLREGLAFHDGAPVTAADCIASLRRWGPRDAMGRLLVASTEGMEALDARRFTIRLRRPFPLMLDTLGRPRNPAAVILPERLAERPGTEQIRDAIGSGPFIFRRDTWVPGASMVFERNPAYVPRAEPGDFLAGGKRVQVERVEWRHLPDASTAVNALRVGEVDYLQWLDFDHIATLRGDRSVVVGIPRGAGTASQGYLRPNHANGPFKDPAIRRVLWLLADTNTVTEAMGVPAELVRRDCRSFWTCGSRYETTAGSEDLPAPSIAAARAALAKTRYAGEPIVFLATAESPQGRAASAVFADALRAAGFNVELQSVDWGTLLARRARREGWDLFSTTALAWDLESPLTHFYTAANCIEFPGWSCEPRMTPLFEAFRSAPDESGRREAATAIHRLAYENVPAVMWGQFTFARAWRAELEGVSAEGLPVFWGIARRPGR
jgi:peptide/nickel transport system substrate-binding protein